MSDYNLVSTGEATWLTPDMLTSALSDSFPGTELEPDLLSTAPVTLWAYVPDGTGHTAEVTHDNSGRMLSFTDASRDLVARIAVLLAQRFPAPDGELQLWRWAPEPVPVSARTEAADLLALPAPKRT